MIRVSGARGEPSWEKADSEGIETDRQTDIQTFHQSIKQQDKNASDHGTSRKERKPKKPPSFIEAAEGTR